MQNIPPIKVSAPANTMLLGEHSVLHGYRAISCALEPRIYVTLTPRTDNIVNIQSELATITTDLKNINSISHSKLSFVLESIRCVIEKNNTPYVDNLQGFDLHIHSEFSHTIGLGSSAAVVAACVFALLLYQKQLNNCSQQINDPQKNILDSVFDIGLSAIHSVQKRGSGSDLVASVYGGLVAYTSEPRDIKPLLFDNNNDSNEQQEINYPQLDLFYCGYKTPTPEVIALVEQSSKQLPDIYLSLYQQMDKVTRRAETAVIQQNWLLLGKLMNIYHGLLDAVGVCDKTLAQLIYEKRQDNNVMGAKISGSGLGDCIVTLSNTVATVNQNLSDENHISANISPYGLIHHK